MLNGPDELWTFLVSFVFTYDAKCNFGVCLSLHFCVSNFCQEFRGVQTPKIPPPSSYGLVVNFGVLVAEIISLVWGTPANFNGFRVLALLLHGTPVLAVSQTLRC